MISHCFSLNSTSTLDSSATGSNVFSHLIIAAASYSEVGPLPAALEERSYTVPLAPVVGAFPFPSRCGEHWTEALDLQVSRVPC